MAQSEFADRLIQMFAVQTELQKRLDPRVFSDDDEVRVQCLKDNIIATIAELFEALDETSWKWWATGTRFDSRRVFEELRDAQQFLMNAMIIATKGEATAHRLFVAHAEKIAINHQREDEGYDGVAGKCPQCRRDLSEVDLKEVVAERLGVQLVQVHCPCGHRVTERVA